MSKPVIKSFEHEVRIIDRNLGLVDYVASDETLDCYREIVRAKGWKFDLFEKNAPFVDSHDYYSIERQLGRVVAFEVKKKQLVERVEWALPIMDDNPLVRIGWKMTLGGFLKAVSVGFIPERSAGTWDGPQEMAEAVKELGLDAETAVKVRCIYLEQQQIELSSCIIGANPNALAKAHREQCIADADLDAAGFDDDGMQFLHDAAEQFSVSDNEAVRRMIGGLWASFSRTLPVRPALSKRKQDPQPATSANGRAAAEEAQQRERTEFLAELKTITKR